MPSSVHEDLPLPSRWQSLDRRLPLLIALLLVAAVTAMAVGAYRAVERTLLEATASRVEASAGQLATLLGRSAEQRQDALAAAAAEPSLRRRLGAPPPAAPDAAAPELAALTGEEQTMAVELWSAAGELVAAAAPPGAPAAEGPVGRRRPSSEGPGPIRVEAGIAFYDLAAPVGEGAGPGERPLGWLVVRRRLSSGAAAEAIGGLIGREARFLLGNAEGGAWTDLAGPAPPPVPGVLAAPRRATVTAGGERRLGVATPVPGTPWLLWVDVPRDAALAPARGFLRQLLALAALLLVAGAVVTYALSRRVTRPLDQLTAAAEGLSGGDLEREVPVRRRDEVGRLARAFDLMRHQVVESRHRLEHRVEERTRELREAQEELVRQERLAILGQLASGVGHELRNPLGVMTNAVFYLEMVLEGAEPEVGEYLAILRHQIGLSEKIVSDLLDFARIKPPERRELVLSELAEQQLERLAPGDELAVERRFPPDLPPAYGDPVQIGQVVLNLVTNAVQAMDGPGGVLTLSGRADGTGAVELEVRDSGPGVPEDIRAHVFEPLFTTKARGIGLGLAVSRRLTEANEGSLDLAEASGGGAAFVLRLPRAPEGGPS